MFGPKPGDVEAIDALGYDAFIAQQLNPAAIDDSACDALLAALPHATLTEIDQFLYDRRNMTWTETIKPLYETRHATWVRMASSKRQLNERMVDFWHNHFNIYAWDYITRSMWSSWDRLIRAHALGNFRQLLGATARHTCMLYYLDNYISTDGGPNENYARELMELHTLGAMNYQVPGGYIDQDVYEVSRCLTGWTFEDEDALPNRGQFKYKNDDHDRFIKLVLGHLIPGDQAPMKDGEDVLDFLAYHPGTARHIATKLAVRFISDYPPASIVNSTAAVFYAARMAPDQIKQTLLHLFSSDEFKNSRMNKMKRPIDWAVSSMRALGMSYSTSSNFNYLYDDLGQPMFSWRPPDGPPDMLENWANSNGMLQRWNWSFQIVSGWYSGSGISFPLDGVLPADRKTPAEIGDWWIARVIARTVSSTTRDALIEFIADGRSWNLALPDAERTTKSRYVAALCTMTPEFMMR